MIKIKRLKQNSETIYPITHENAVYDSNGIAISDKYMTKTEGHNHANKDALDTITIAKINTWNNKSDFDGNYNNLTNKPTIPSLEGYATESYVDGEIFKGLHKGVLGRSAQHVAYSSNGYCEQQTSCGG